MNESSNDSQPAVHRSEWSTSGATAAAATAMRVARETTTLDANWQHKSSQLSQGVSVKEFSFGWLASTAGCADAGSSREHLN